MLLAAVDQIDAPVRRAIDHVGRDRVGVVIGTSTSGIAEGERAIAEWIRAGHTPQDYGYRKQRLSSGSDFLTNYLDIGGPSMTISTACLVAPPSFAVFVKNRRGIPDSFTRYLQNKIRDRFGFEGSPVRVVYRER